MSLSAVISDISWFLRCSCRRWYVRDGCVNVVLRYTGFQQFY